MGMIQPILTGCESVKTDLSVFLNSEESTHDVYLGLALLERVKIDPSDLQHKMLVGRLRNADVKFCVLHEIFGHDNRTVKKWSEALKSNDLDQMVKAFSGRKVNKKVSAELVRYVRQLYLSRKSLNLGKAYRKKIIRMTEEIFGISISPSLASEIYRDATEFLFPRQKTVPETGIMLDNRRPV